MFESILVDTEESLVDAMSVAKVSWGIFFALSIHAAFHVVFGG